MPHKRKRRAKNGNGDSGSQAAATGTEPAAALSRAEEDEDVAAAGSSDERTKRRRLPTSPTPTSKFWALDESLCADRVAKLRLRRIGGAEGAPAAPTPAQEVCRARAVLALRQTFARLCAKHKVKTGGSEIFFDKWHCAWIQEAASAALAAAMLAPAEPLLPELPGPCEDGSEAAARLDAALVKALAFLDRSRVEALARELRLAASKAAATLREDMGQIQKAGQVEASVSDGGGSVVLRYKKTKVSVAKGHFQKLRALFQGGDESSFLNAAFCCLLRYQSVLQKGFQGACTAEVFSALRDVFDARFECFASPLNCHYRSMCSAFPDTDGIFGSLGSFFAFNPRVGAFQANPPFLDDVIIKMAAHMESLLARADEAGKALTFVIIVVGNEGSRSGSAALGALRKSRFGRANLTCRKNEHRYNDGEQHTNEETRLSPCDTAVFVLQSQRAYEKNPPTDDKMGVISQSFSA